MCTNWFARIRPFSMYGYILSYPEYFTEKPKASIFVDMNVLWGFFARLLACSMAAGAIGLLLRACLFVLPIELLWLLGKHGSEFLLHIDKKSKTYFLKSKEIISIDIYIDVWNLAQNRHILSCLSYLFWHWSRTELRQHTVNTCSEFME